MKGSQNWVQPLLNRLPYQGWGEGGGCDGLCSVCIKYIVKYLVYTKNIMNCSICIKYKYVFFINCYQYQLEKESLQKDTDTPWSDKIRCSGSTITLGPVNGSLEDLGAGFHPMITMLTDRWDGHDDTQTHK